MTGWNKPIKGFGFSLSDIAQKFYGGRSTRFGIGAVSDIPSSALPVTAIFESHPTVAIYPDSFGAQFIAVADNSANPGRFSTCISCIEYKIYSYVFKNLHIVLLFSGEY